MDLDRVKEIGQCCCCGQPTKQDGHLNMVDLDMDATWPYPVWGNILTGERNLATAVICDNCWERGQTQHLDFLYVIEYLGDQLVYHDYIPRTHGAN